MILASLLLIGLQSATNPPCSLQPIREDLTQDACHVVPVPAVTGPGPVTPGDPKITRSSGSSAQSDEGFDRILAERGLH
jgi:hypothetical protein